LLVAAVACREPAATYRDYVPVVRVIDLVPPALDPQVTRGGDVVIDGETRRVVSTAAMVNVEGVPRSDARGLHFVVPVPAAARAWGRVDVVRTVVHNRSVTRSWPERLPSAHSEILLALQPNEQLIYRMATLRAVDSPWQHAVTTQPFDVPPGAVLTFATGIDALHDPTPMLAHVRVEHDGGEETVWERTFRRDEGGWREERVSLGAFAGRSIRLHFDCSPIGTRYGGPVVFGEPLVLAPRTTPAPALNVVLVSMDTLRARSVSAFGCARETTPTLDAFAREGVLFENATSTASWTLPGHASMLTGLWVRTHGVPLTSSALPPDRPTLPEILREAGYATAAFTGGGWITARFGFRRGFETFLEHGPGPVPPPGGVPEMSFMHGLAWIKAHSDRPFFAFLHSYLVHAPHDAPVPYARFFDGPPFPATTIAADELAYDREVRYADDQIAALLDGLDALGLRDRTLVVVTADHGEAFDEHGATGHQHIVHDEVARVPLVMRLPGAFPPGRIVTTPVSIADVTPTILDAVGLPPAPRLDATSLLPLATGAVTHLARDAVFTESQATDNGDTDDLVAAHAATRTCMLRAGVGTMCWDERTDPWQRFPPLPNDDPASGPVREVLARFAGRPSALAAASGDGTVATRTGLDDEHREQLRALGYLDK
jgi:arylsulfatase A-like enzyme